MGGEDALEDATATPYPPRRSPTPPQAAPSPPPPPPQASKKRSALAPKASVPHPTKKQAQAPSGKKMASEKLSYEKSDEELIASTASDVKAHFEKTKKEIEAKRRKGCSKES